MQIFCFDMMLMQLCTARRRGPGFLIHDVIFSTALTPGKLPRLEVGSELASHSASSTSLR